MRACAGILVWLCVWVLGVGCGRVIGGEADVARFDASFPPGCEVPEQQIVISTGNGPAVVHGIDRLPDGNYLVGATEGGPGSAATGLYVVDGNTLQVLSFAPVSGETVLARYDAYGDSILAVGTQGDAASLLWLPYANGEVSEIQDSAALCSGCEASWGLPASGDPEDASPLGLAVAVQHNGAPGEDEIQVFLVDRGAPGVARPTTRILGSKPSLAPGYWGYMLTYTSPSGLLATRIVRVEGTMDAERELDILPVPGRANASVTSRAETINAVVLSAPLGGQQLRTVSAPHPEGFVVIWSVAHDAGGDGLFGKIISVTP